MQVDSDFTALLKYRTAEEGGRTLPAFSGYRPTIKFEFEDIQSSGVQKFIGRQEVHPGETVEAEIKIYATDYFEGKLYEGLKFEFREGQNIIGTGRILKILNMRLSASR